MNSNAEPGPTGFQYSLRSVCIVAAILCGAGYFEEERYGLLQGYLNILPFYEPPPAGLRIETERLSADELMSYPKLKVRLSVSDDRFIEVYSSTQAGRNPMGNRLQGQSTGVWVNLVDREGNLVQRIMEPQQFTQLLLNNPYSDSLPCRFQLALSDDRIGLAFQELKQLYFIELPIDGPVAKVRKRIRARDNTVQWIEGAPFDWPQEVPGDHPSYFEPTNQVFLLTSLKWSEGKWQAGFINEKQNDTATMTRNAKGEWTQNPALK